MPKHLEKFWCWPNISCHTLYGQHEAQCSRQNAWCGWHNAWCGQHNAWCGQRNACEVWWVGQNQSLTPPHMAKNKLLLNEYLGIFMHFESIFFYFFKSGKFQIFFFTSPATKKVRILTKFRSFYKTLLQPHNFLSFSLWLLRHNLSLDMAQLSMYVHNK